MEVKVVRLITNEELIAQIEVNEDRDTTTIKNGTVVVPAGEGKMAIVPWLPHAENSEVEIENKKIMFTFDPIKDIANQYNAQFGSGIVVPDMAMSNAASMGSDSGLDNFKIG